MGKVVCLVNKEALLVGCLGGSVPMIGIYGAAGGEMETSGFGLQVVIVGSLCVSGTCTLQISCGTISKLE